MHLSDVHLWQFTLAVLMNMKCGLGITMSKGGAPEQILPDSRQMSSHLLSTAFAEYIQPFRRCGEVINGSTISQRLMHNLVTNRLGGELSAFTSLVSMWCAGQMSSVMTSRQSTAKDIFLSSLLRMSSDVTQIGLTSEDGSWVTVMSDYRSSSAAGSERHLSDSLTRSLSQLLAKHPSAQAGANIIGAFRVTYLWYTVCDADDTSAWQIVALFNSTSDPGPSRKCHDKSGVYAFYAAIPLSSVNVNFCSKSSRGDISRPGCNYLQSRCHLLPHDGYSAGALKCCCGFEANELCINNTADGRSLRSLLELLSQLCTASTETITVDGNPSMMAKVFLAINVFSILAASALIFFLASQKKFQEANTSKGALMEFGLFGAILMYSKMILEFFPPQPITCCLITWCRQLGFTVFYGALILMIYSNLVDRRPRRTNQTGSLNKVLLRDISYMIAFTTTGLIAWTMAIYEFSDFSKYLYISNDNGFLPGVQFVNQITPNTCTLFKWHFFWHAIEICLLFYGMYLCFKSRSSFSTKRNRFLVAIIIELVVTTVVNSVRYKFWPTFDPNLTIIVSFVQVHLTVTLITVILLSKHYYGKLGSSNNENDKLSGSKRNQSSLAKLRDRILNGTLDFAELPISDMNPEDIRAELKRVYTQLRMFKLTNMYVENPHIQKKKIRKQSHTAKRTSVSHGGSRSLYDVTSSKAETEEASTALTSNEVESPSKLTTGDYTVHSAAHNVYLTEGNLTVTQRMLMDNDGSTQI
uniref:G_PROTEIN_RECEP_F3_4 domain-containing protein n=1 Tax=Trichuris muris TaxID=70415 RepID=A0A5S6QAJ7_TRIMR